MKLLAEPFPLEMSLRELWASTARYLRSNRARVIFMSLAGVGMAATSVFLHSQYRRVHQILDEQRAIGARVLRARYVANSQTVKDCLDALLPIARGCVKDGPFIKAEHLVLMLRDPTVDKGKKRDLWERLKIATFVELIGAAYIVAMLHAVLSLQCNLVFRDFGVDENALVELPPTQPIGTDTKNAYMHKVREHVLSASFVNAVFSALEDIATNELAEVSLKQRLGRDDVARRVRHICDMVNFHGLDELSGNWLFAVDNERDLDEDVQALLAESVDLANELDISKVIHEATFSLLDSVLDQITVVEWGNSQRIPCAQLLAPLHKAGNELLECVPDCLDTEPVGQQFAAAVLISGEQESVEPMRGFS